MKIKTNKLKEFIAITELSKLQGMHNPSELYKNILVRLQDGDFTKEMSDKLMLPRDLADIITDSLFLKISTPLITEKIIDVVLFMISNAEQAFILNNKTLFHITIKCINRFNKNEITEFIKQYPPYGKHPTYIGKFKASVANFIMRLEIAPDEFPQQAFKFANESNSNMDVYSGENSCIVNKILSLYAMYYVHMGATRLKKGTLYNTRSTTFSGKGIVPSVSYKLKVENRILHADLTMVKFLNASYDIMWCDSCDDEDIVNQLVTVKPCIGKPYDLELEDVTTIDTLLRVKAYDSKSADTIKSLPKCKLFLSNKGVQFPNGGA